MKGGKTPSKPQKPKEKSVKTNPDEKVIEKPVEKTTELVDNDKKPIEEPKLEEKPTDTRN